jgi:hemerythrin superfamily protein
MDIYEYFNVVEESTRNVIFEWLKLLKKSLLKTNIELYLQNEIEGNRNCPTFFYKVINFHNFNENLAIFLRQWETFGEKDNNKISLHFDFFPYKDYEDEKDYFGEINIIDIDKI